MLFSRFFPSKRRFDSRSTTLRRRKAGAGQQSLEVLEGRMMLSGGYTGPIYRGVDYAPTWPNWAPKALTQFEDSDFYNHAFRGLWGSGDGQGRNDLANIGSTDPNGIGFNEVRLYNWGPVRGWDGRKGNAHLAFLKYADEQGVKVMVPVSNYFVGSGQYSWGQAVPNDRYSKDSAPPAIQAALKNFVSSITMANGRISPAVDSIEIGNETDHGIGFGEPSPTVKLKRDLWWVVNLHEEILKVEQKYGSSTPIPLTIPVTNSDQTANGSNLSWFEAFVNGVNAGQQMPTGSTPAGTGDFTAKVTGLKGFPWSSQGWYFNSYQTYQTGVGLTGILQQYDTGGVAGGPWSQQWPGQQFPGIPLQLTELGLDRITAGGEANQVTDVAGQVQTVLNYLNTPGPHNFRGFDVFEYNDEPNKNGTTQPNVFTDAVYGIYKYYPTNDYNYAKDFRVGTVLYNLKTGKTDLNYSPLDNGDNFFASTEYPVYQLNPINNNGVTLASLLKKELRGS